MSKLNQRLSRADRYVPHKSWADITPCLYHTLLYASTFHLSTVTDKLTRGRDRAL